jgi:HK97 family phage major capsid protein
LRGCLFGDDRAKRWCHNHGMEFRSESRALSEGINTAGGFLVPEEMLTAIIDLREQHGVFRRECRVVPMGRDAMTVPRVTGNASATFVGENTALTESEATWNNVELNAKKLGVLTRVSSELAEDAVIDLADWVARDFAWAFAKKEDQCGFIGDASATYGGMTGITQILEGTLGNAGAVDTATANADLFTEIALLDINTLMSVLPAYAYEAGNCKFYCSQVANALVFDRLKAAGGGNTVADLEGRVQRSFLGFPIIISSILPTTTASLDNEAMLLFGDLSQSSTLGDRRQIAVSVSTDRYFVEDQIAIKATERFHIVNHDLGDATNAGPLVSLVGTA